ncbi:MAG: hypothetical protein II132_00570, partial [Desulfovibrio sp.]|nr:hypothetical protein [Desulfovibrio sp.]
GQGREWSRTRGVKWHFAGSASGIAGTLPAGPISPSKRNFEEKQIFLPKGKNMLAIYSQNK